MRILRNHLITAFGIFQPERLISDLYRNFYGHKKDWEIVNYIPDLLTFRSFALEYYKNLTYEELDALYGNMCRIIEKRGAFCGGKSIFALLPEYTLHVLELDSSVPICRQSERLNWRSCYLQLGQDLLTAAHLAYISVNENRNFGFFGWPALIGTNDRRLIEILNKGLAENHFHLNGSTRGFDLSWICLMNHPRQITNFFSEIKGNRDEESINDKLGESLFTSVSFSTLDNRMSWKHRLFCACWLRAILFIWLQSGSSPFDNPCDKKATIKRFFDLVKKIDAVSSLSLENYTDAAKFLYGKCGKFKQPGGKMKLFDYAITSFDMHNDSPCRSLSGERKFLYDAFTVVYSGKANTSEWCGFTDLLYLYVLIKTHFRHELIQCNSRYGFKNFAKYQDRKDIIFENFPEYALEAKNLSINDGILRKRVNSLEARVGPKAPYYKQRLAICKIDDSVAFLQGQEIPRLSQDRKEKGMEHKWFYVLHFPKIPENKGKKREFSFLNKPRNAKLRAKSEYQAISVARAMERFDWLNARIRGIDACTFEIGCRPEIFATEFKFLRDFACTELSESYNYSKDILQPKLCATYHVGEDFLDILDGLRAIDEALLFLEMKPGERLGHALALGVDAHEYYALKNSWIVLPKQDYLDNIVWVLNKAKVLNLNLSSAFKQRLTDKATTLIYEIFGSNYQLCDYYSSWLLRGDDPELYRFGLYESKEYERGSTFPANNTITQYNRHRIREFYHPQKLSVIRENKSAAKLYSMYHYDYDVRSRGEECEEINISEDYIKLVEDIQKGMQREIAERQIGIECNPSSNVLIGSFNLYKDHPIFKFYPVIQTGQEIVQFVTINTDDQGVFDTSLEEEFALLECSMRKMRNQNHEPSYNDEQIYQYLEQIRKNGFSQAFPKANFNSNNSPNT